MWRITFQHPTNQSLNTVLAEKDLAKLSTFVADFCHTIPDPTHGSDFWSAHLIKFLAQARDVDVDDIGHRVRIGTPSRRQDALSAVNTAWV